MKEVISIIRLNMINKTKQALLLGGFPAMYCRKVSGRGKKKVDFSIVEKIISEGIESTSSVMAEAVSEGYRLIPKRLVSVVVNDDDVEKVVNLMIDTNSTGNPGDGKIFVMDVKSVVRVRTGEKDELAI